MESYNNLTGKDKNKTVFKLMDELSYLRIKNQMDKISYTLQLKKLLEDLSYNDLTVWQKLQCNFLYSICIIVCKIKRIC